MDEGVAMQAAEARELCVVQAGNGADDAGLLAVVQLGLEADDVVERAERIVLAELHHGVGPLVAVRVVQADRLHRAVAQRLRPALGHHLDGQAALEVGRRLFPPLEIGLLDWKGVVSGKSVSVRVDFGGRRSIKKKKIQPRYKITALSIHKYYHTIINNTNNKTK